ncbi:MAG: hypothetical protein IJA69_04455 [Clostridia bacterium]|nr:hypothetical protein [Clostridia bacterium]
MENLQQNIQILLKNSNFCAIGEQNPKLKQIKGIVANTKPNPKKLFVSEGIKMHYDIERTKTKIESLIICVELIKTEEAFLLLKKLICLAENVFEVSKKTFEKLSERDNPDGMLSLVYLPRPNISEFKPKHKSVILILDGVEIPGNIGTMIRMSDGAGVDAIFVCNKKARLTHPKVIKASQGALLVVPIFEFENIEDCYRFLEDNNFVVYLADTRAEKTYYQTKFSNKTAIVMGSERYGITKGWYARNNELLSIPMLGGCDSLNVATAATVIVYEATKQIKLES